MPRNRRMKLMEESNGASGEFPEYGAIFMSNSSTRKECLRRELFGLPIFLAEFVKQVKAGMILFLFEFESRELHGVFQACSDGAVNIEPNAFRSSGKQFPAQVKFTEKWRCRPLRECEFRHAICENYFTAKKFNFGLSKSQVQKLLNLFNLKKLERSGLRKTLVSKTERKTESNLGITVGDRGFRNRREGETDGDVDREFPFRETSTGDLLGCRLTENYCVGDECDIGLEYDPTKGSEYSGDTSGVCRRLVDPNMNGSEDIVGYDLSMSNSFGTVALTNYSVVNDRRAPKNVRHAASGWLENGYHKKDSITQACSWSNKERFNFKSELVVPAQSSVPLEPPYGTSTERYDPFKPGIMRDAAIKSSRHDLGAHTVDSMRSAFYTANVNYVSREKIIPGGGYASDNLPLEAVQQFSDEHYGTIMNKSSSLDLDDYIPIPTEHREYQTKTGMTGVAYSESESRNGHLHHSQFSSLLTSKGASENMMNFERPSYFAYHLSSPDLSPNDRVNNKISGYQDQGESGGHISYSNNRMVLDSRIYPSFTFPSTSGDGSDLYPESTTQKNVQAYQWQDSENRVIQMKDRVNPTEHERKRTRKSVFSRLSMPSKECDAERDTSPDTESVDGVMNFINDCHKHWMEQNMSNLQDFGKTGKKNKKVHAAEVFDNVLMLPFSDTTPDDMLDCEESMEHSTQKLPFIDFKRRSKTEKSHCNPNEDGPEHSALQNKKRKLLRPKLIEDDREKDNPIENVLASQSATEAHVHDFLGRGDQ